MVNKNDDYQNDKKDDSYYADIPEKILRLLLRKGLTEEELLSELLRTISTEEGQAGRLQTKFHKLEPAGFLQTIAAEEQGIAFLLIISNEKF